MQVYIYVLNTYITYTDGSNLMQYVSLIFTHTQTFFEIENNINVQ